jgi:hypothetical protein
MIEQALRDLVDMVEGHVKADYPMGVAECATLAQVLEALADQAGRVERVTNVARATLALEAIEQMDNDLEKLR